jgi:hypothetical protein
VLVCDELAAFETMVHRLRAHATKFAMSQELIQDSFDHQARTACATRKGAVGTVAPKWKNMRSLPRSQDLKTAGVVNAAEAPRRKATVEA